MVLFSFITFYLFSYILSWFVPNKPQGILLCGIAGFNGKNPVDITKLRWLLCMNERRGITSTGMFTVKEDKEATQTLYKKAKAANKFIKDIGFHEAAKGATTVQAHTRAATVGSGTDANAHPFEYDFTGTDKGTRVVGLHNGMVIEDLWPRYAKQFNFTADKDLPGYNKVKDEFDVDSMLIFAVLAKTGDYKILPHLEGAITITFMMPDKYPGISFLYKRAARELNIGRSREGIYWSSEAEPLELIGCTDIESVPDDYLLLIKDGEIYDAVEMAPAKIKIPLNVGRNDWQSRVNKNDYAEYEEIVDIKFSNVRTPSHIWYHAGKKHWLTFEQWNMCDDKDKGRGEPETNVNWKPQQHQLPFRSGPSNGPSARIVAEKEIIVFDELNTILADAKKELENMKEFVEMSAIADDYRATEIAEQEDCLVIIKLVSPKHKDGLPGWLVFDKINEKVFGASSVDGIVVLQYPANLGNIPQSIRIVDPVITNDVFTHTITPRCNKVLEVTLTIPFPEKKSSTRSNSGEADKLSDRCAEFGAIISNNTHDELTKASHVCSFKRISSNPLSESGEQVHMRYEKGENNESGTKNSEEYLFVSKTGSRVGAKTPVNGRKDGIISMRYPAERPIEDVQEIIEAENKTFRYKNVVLKAINEPDYLTVLVDFRNHFKRWIDVRRILADAVVLRAYDKERVGESYSLGLYAYDLLIRNQQEYLVAGEIGKSELYSYCVIVKEYRLNHIPKSALATEDEVRKDIFKTLNVY